MAQLWVSPISINSGQVPSTQTDFPVLVSLTDARFKTTGNGGHVASSSGYDIRPYTDSTLATAITGFELEKYVASTGELIMWVKVSSLSSSTTPFVLGYGDTSLTTDGSSNTTWSNNFAAVLHLSDGTTLNFNDSTSNGRGFTGVNTPTATTGKIDGAMACASASNQYCQRLAGDINPSAITASAWINGTSFPGSYNTVIGKGGGSANYCTIDVKSNGKLHCEVLATNARSYDGTGSTTLSTGTSYFVAVTYDSSAGLVGYVNGSSDGTVAANGTLNTGSVGVQVGHNSGFNCCPWNGWIDEVRFSSVARTANWIATEYNNQSAPGTFETLGSESAVGGTSTGNMFLLFP